MESVFVYVLGFLAQGLFSARILVQWIMSERAKKVVSPTIFWILSLIASYLFFIYGWLRDDFSIMLGQVIASNLWIFSLSLKKGTMIVNSYFEVGFISNSLRKVMIMFFEN
jgi:lipid-A-disaccharide synthase-like uncharacterized protein